MPNLLVPTVTTNEARATDIIGRLNGLAGGSAAYLSKSVDASELAAQAIRLLVDPWSASTSPQLRIDK